MEVRVLGPLEVRHEGVSQPIVGAKARALLSLLAIRPNMPISPEALIDELWEGTPPPTAASALRVHIGKVRKALEPGRDNTSTSTRLPLERAGYALRVAPTELDSLLFEELAQRGREANAHGDVHAAEEALERAMDLWRGPALLDVRGFAAARGAIARLDQVRLSALEELGDVRLALGKHAELVELLSQAVNEFPLAERLTAQLMLALYRSDRQADALRACSALARRLVEELGMQPSAAVRRLEEDILLQRDRIDFVGRTSRESASTLSTSAPKLFGRNAEQERLRDLYDAAASGGRRLALVSGTAGIGKTTLAAACAKRAGERGATVVTSSCGADPDAPSPIAQILERVLPLLDAETQSEAQSALDLLHASPSADARVTPGEPDYPSEQLRLHSALARTIASLPVCPVLVIEDAQWADESALLALRQLLRHPEIDRLLVIVTYRNDQIDERRANTISRLAPRGSTETVHLTGLNEYGVRSLVRAVMGPQADPALLGVAVTLRDATDGNPFHLRALLDELDVTSIGSIGREELEHRIDNLAPLDVRDLVAERAARLTERSLSVVRTAATISRGISPDLLADVCALSVDEILDAIDEASGAGLMVEDAHDIARFEFAHALVRNAIYFGIPDDERHRTHLRVAQTMEAHNERSPHAHSQNELAKHFNAALPEGNLAKAGYYAARAGHDASARLAFTESAQWYEWAIEAATKLRSPESELGQLELCLAGAHQGLRQTDAARDAFLRAAQHARAAADRHLLADIALAANTNWISGFDAHEWGRELLDEALATLDETELALRAQILARLATRYFYADPAECEGFARRAVELSAALGDDIVSAQALLSRRLTLARDPAASHGRLELTERALRLVGDEPSAVGLRIRRELLTDLLECAELGRFESELERYERDARELASARDLYWAMVSRATERTLRGDLSTAEQLVRGAAIRGFDLDFIVSGTEYLQQFVIHFQQGRLSELGGTPAVQADSRPAYRAGASLSAIALADAGRLDEARRVARWAVGPDGHAIARDGFWLAAHALLAVVAAATGDRDLVVRLDDMISPCADQLVTFGAGAAVLGSGHYWLGVLADAQGMPDRAVEHLMEAELVATRIRAPYWLAQARLDLANVLERRDRSGDRDRADELRAEAIRAAELGGFGRILSRSTSPHPH